MTMPVPQSGGYTHRDWKTEMAVAATCIAGIRRDLDEMAASAAEVRAGQTHRQLVDVNRITALELLKGVIRLVGDTDGRYLPVYEAIRSAGGQHEVAHKKSYHQNY